MIEGLLISFVLSLVPISFLSVEALFIYGTIFIDPEVVEFLYSNQTSLTCPT